MPTLLWVVIRGQLSGIALILVYNLVIKDKVARLTSNCNHMPFHSYLLLGLGIAETSDNVHERLSSEMQRLVKRVPVQL